MYVGRRPPWRRVVMTSFLAYAISNNVGFAMLSGASVRYRFYTRWGITAEELSRIVFSYVVTFWLGLLLIGGLSLASALPARAWSVRSGRLAPVGGCDGGEPGLCCRGGLRLGPIRFGAWNCRFHRACHRAARDFHSGLDDRRGGPARAPAAWQRPVSHASGSVPGFTADRTRQPHSRRSRCIRGVDGTPLEAVHSVNHAAAGADCVSGGVLPASAFSCGSRARRRRAPSATIASGTSGCHARMVDRATDTTCIASSHLVGCVMLASAPRRQRQAASACSIACFRLASSSCRLSPAAIVGAGLRSLSGPARRSTQRTS